MPKTFESKSAPVTYFGFDKLDSGRTVRDAFQIIQIKGVDKLNPLDPLDKSWSDGRLRAEFDTLPLFDNGVPQVRTSRMFGDRPRAPLEPFTKAYPELPGEYTSGGIPEAAIDPTPLNQLKITPLKD
ncbi:MULTISPECIES: hypothetical protein [Enterobacter]|uniref:hypothetical protein n=1 Tax=Enterobacter TaxID=547 RepID=UPI00111323EF|nr:MULTISPECIES: hypothetical protein [Enterobacter cloacae complex]MEC5766044.1 hypothetical protein [Enterobacter chengduensis]NBC77470.1 hypothetical protein [Enterobacter asburiae]HBM9901954.1 hypothetical protein [Enterobacter chengduensis]